MNSIVEFSRPNYTGDQVRRIFFTLLVIAAISSSIGLHAQTFTAANDSDIPASEFALDVKAKPVDYAGGYHFGESEWESNLELTVRGNKVTGVLTYGVYNEKTKKWKSRTMRFTGTIVGNMLIADGWNGLFVRRGDTHGLLLMNAKRDVNEREFGYLMPSVRSDD